MKKNNHAWLGFTLAVLVIVFLISLDKIIFPFFMGLIGAYAFNYFVTAMEHRGISRGIGSAFIILGVLISLSLLVVVFLPLVQRELFILAAKMPAIIESWVNLMRPLLEKSTSEFGTPLPSDIKAQVTSHMGDIINWSIKLLTNILTNGLALANILSLTILTPVIMFYLLKDWPKLVTQIDQNIPKMYQQNVRFYANQVNITLSAYVRGQALVCFILMVLYSLSLWIIGVPHGFFLGIMTGFMSFIPYIGMLAGLLGTLAISLANFVSWGQIFMILLTFTVIGAIEGNFLSPRLIGEKVGLHPVWIIFSLLASATWFGFLGVLVALPLAAIIGVIVRILLQWYRSSSFYQPVAASQRNDV